MAPKARPPRLCACGAILSGNTKGEKCRACWIVPDSVRFWHYVQKSDGCWEWTGAIAPTGYGVFRSKLAHRVSLAIALNREVSSFATIDHLCRNRRCVRPDHLEEVGDKVNIQRGLSSRLTPALVEEIRQRVASEGYRALARRIGVSHSAVVQAAHGRSWSNISTPPIPATRGKQP